MTPTELAVKIIGNNPERNRSLGAGLKGKGHIEKIAAKARELGAGAEPLLHALRHESVQMVFDAYDRHDTAAGRAQARYKRAQHLLFWPIVLALAAGLLSFILPMKDMANGYVRQFAHQNLESVAVSTALRHAGLIAFAAWLLLVPVTFGSAVWSHRLEKSTSHTQFGEWLARRISSWTYWPVALILSAGLLFTAHHHWSVATVALAIALILLAIRRTVGKSNPAAWHQKQPQIAASLKASDQFVNRERATLAWVMLVVALLAAAAFYFHSPSKYAAYAKGLQADDVELTLRVAAVKTVFFSLAAAVVFALCLNPAKHYKDWNQARGTAEALRRELFERALSVPSPKGAIEPMRLPLMLEYFQRYQVQLQQAYFKTRGQEHEWSASVARWLERVVIGALLVWCFAEIGTAWSGTSEQGAAGWPSAQALQWVTSPWAWTSGKLQTLETNMSDIFMLGLSVVLALIAAGAKLHAILNASVRNASRYDTARENFKHIEATLDGVRKAAAMGGEDGEKAVRAYVARVHSIMSNELSEWVNIAELEAGRTTAVAAPEASVAMAAPVAASIPKPAAPVAVAPA
jgi:hypothetical protein